MVLVIAPKLSIYDDVTSGAGCGQSLLRMGFDVPNANFLFFCSSIITKKREINVYETRLCLYCLYWEKQLKMSLLTFEVKKSSLTRSKVNLFKTGRGWSWWWWCLTYTAIFWQLNLQKDLDAIIEQSARRAPKWGFQIFIIKIDLFYENNAK